VGGVLHFCEGPDDPAVVTDQQGLEALQLAVGGDLNTVGVVDQRIGEDR
jgi:hypothetical protein